MKSNKNIELFRTFAEERGLQIGNEFLEKILEFCELILEENKKQNLVSKNDEGKLLTRHIADSLVFATPTPTPTPQTNWTDIGSGAGFPVVPLALYFPTVSFFAVENRRLRCEFLNEVKRKLNIENLQIVKSSAESSGLQNMDFVSCRAVGSLAEDFNKAKSILKKTGHFLTVKSKRTIDELREKKDPLLSASLVEFYKLPLEENEYALVIID
ncbi:ribosomal RNA small subunit methyltransferase G [Fibrobacterales bacterium]|nr:ribosomal RNA small subunit methyltransferase G [Fibrobacterales bacterium]